MVHALKQVHRMLRPGGLLINMHNLPIPHVIEVHTAGAVIKAGWLMDNADYEDERYALDSLARLVSEGIFLLKDERDFGFNIFADDPHELRAWLDEWWETAVLTDQTIQRIEKLFQQSGQSAKIVIKVPTRMTVLKAMPQG